MVGVTSTYHTFALTYCFMQEKREVNYFWTMQEATTGILRDGYLPKPFLANRELALMRATKIVFSNVNRLV